MGNCLSQANHHMAELRYMNQQLQDLGLKKQPQQQHYEPPPPQYNNYEPQQPPQQIVINPFPMLLTPFFGEHASTAVMLGQTEEAVGFVEEAIEDGSAKKDATVRQECKQRLQQARGMMLTIDEQLKKSGPAQMTITTMNQQTQQPESVQFNAFQEAVNKLKDRLKRAESKIN